MIATNNYGNSLVSVSDQSDILMTNPGEPFGLKEDITFRNATTLALTWSKPEFMGGDSSVIYVVSVESSNSGTFDIIRSEETSAVITSLTPGDTYQFKVLAKN